VARLAATFDDMASQLQRAFERERALEAGRRDLIAAISHDLRTPLTTVRAMVEAITDGVVDEPAEVRRYLDLMAGEVQHLGRLIDDLFELSQIESGALQLQLEATSLGPLVDRTVSAYQAQARESAITLEEAVDPVLPTVVADPPRLERVLRNLLDNALRYTPAGGRISVAARAEGQDVRVTVADTGPGLPPDDLERVFDRFYRAGQSRSRGEGPRRGHSGAGLGLTIARGVIQAHGGRIWAELPPGGGTAFHFTLHPPPARTPRATLA
jgi:two-component system phosphate regulon sensor histidine kinase PhoR